MFYCFSGKFSSSGISPGGYCDECHCWGMFPPVIHVHTSLLASLLRAGSSPQNSLCLPQVILEGPRWIAVLSFGGVEEYWTNQSVLWSIHAGSIKALVKQQHKISQFFFSDCLPFRALLGWRILFSRESSIEIENFSCWQLLLSCTCLCCLNITVWYYWRVRYIDCNLCIVT